MPTSLTRRQILASAAATAAVAAMPIAAIAEVHVVRSPFAWFVATPEIRELLAAMPAEDDLPVLNAYLERMRAVSWPVYQASTYPRRWIEAVVEYRGTDRRFVAGDEYDDDSVADAADLVGRSWFIASTPKNWSLIDSLPQRAEVPLTEYMALVTELGDNLERRHGDRGPRIYIAFNDSGHRHFEVPHSAACGGFPERYAPEPMKLRRA